MPIYAVPHAHQLFFVVVVYLYLLFSATLINTTRYMFEHSLLVDQVDKGGWNAFEETIISQKVLSYKAWLCVFYFWVQTIVICSVWSLLSPFA